MKDTAIQKDTGGLKMLKKKLKKKKKLKEEVRLWEESRRCSDPNPEQAEPLSKKNTEEKDKTSRHATGW